MRAVAALLGAAALPRDDPSAPPLVAGVVSHLMRAARDESFRTAAVRGLTNLLHKNLGDSLDLYLEMAYCSPPLVRGAFLDALRALLAQGPSFRPLEARRERWGGMGGGELTRRSGGRYAALRALLVEGGMPLVRVLRDAVDPSAADDAAALLVDALAPKRSDAAAPPRYTVVLRAIGAAMEAELAQTTRCANKGWPHFLAQGRCSAPIRSRRG